MSRTESVEWKLAKRLYELNRQNVDKCGNGLVVITDHHKKTIAWDDINQDNRLCHEIMEDYLFVAEELLNGLAGTEPMKKQEVMTDPFKMTQKEILSMYPHFATYKDNQGKTISLLTMQTLLFLETKGLKIK